MPTEENIEQSGFFTATETQDGTYDRVYMAEDFANYFSLFVGDGVFINPINQLKVYAKKGLTVTVKAGCAFIEGYWYKLTQDKDITFDVNMQSAQVDAVVICSLDKVNREISIKARADVRSIYPLINEMTHDLILCRIPLKTGQNTITDSDIIDTRGDKELCGYVTGLVDQIDTTDLFKQLESSFNTWFDRIKGVLSSDAAGNLQNQIDGIYKNSIKTKEEFETVQGSGKLVDATAVKQILDSDYENLDKYFIINPKFVKNRFHAFKQGNAVHINFFVKVAKAGDWAYGSKYQVYKSTLPKEYLPNAGKDAETENAYSYGVCTPAVECSSDLGNQLSCSTFLSSASGDIEIRTPQRPYNYITGDYFIGSITYDIAP